MSLQNNLGGIVCVIGVALITVTLIDTFGITKAILFGCGLALISGGIIRAMKKK